MHPTVETASGTVRGVQHPGHQAFLGIPFAAPPVGPLRFRAPQPVPPWVGVLDADHPGPWAPQNETLLAARIGGDDSAKDEDCLTLNIWTPGSDANRRPVMVWIHGGAFLTGSGAGTLYQGDRLARRGDVVVVTVNYRLGLLGFAAGEALRTDEDGGAAGNWGLLDQLAALRWVRDNIAGFGGDPANVTVFGESAGSMSVTTLVAMPAARGLFRRIIGQSGGPSVATLEQAERTLDQVLAGLGLPGDHRGAAALRDVPVDRLLAVQQQVGITRRLGDGLPFSPIVDGASLPATPTAAAQAGVTAGFEVLVGTNREEATLFALGDRRAFTLDDAALQRRVVRLLPQHGDEAIETYTKARTVRGDPATPTAVWIAILSDLVFRVPVLRFAEAHAAHQPGTWSYLFTWPTPVLGGILGSPHALELPFVFGTLDVERFAAFTGAELDRPAATALSGRMMDTWVAFARDGRPPDWPPYEAAGRQTMVIDRDWQAVGAPMEEERGFWERVGDR